MPITNSASDPLFAVFGATGGQGGSVVRAIHASATPFRVRAITRDASKPAAQALAALGCEVVAIPDISTIDGARKAVEGAEVVFAITLTDYTQKGVSRAKEVSEGKAQMDAAKAEGVRTVVWSGEVDLEEASGGKYPSSVHRFDVKQDIARYGRSLNAFTLLDVQPGSFAANFLSPRQGPRKTPDGRLILALAYDADARIPIIDVEADFGAYVLAALESGAAVVHAAQAYYTPVQLAEAFTKVSGKTVTHVRVGHAELHAAMAQRNPYLAEAMVQMFTALNDFGYYAGGDLGPSNTILSRPARTFEETLRANKEAVDALLL